MSTMRTRGITRNENAPIAQLGDHANGLASSHVVPLACPLGLPHGPPSSGHDELKKALGSTDAAVLKLRRSELKPQFEEDEAKTETVATPDQVTRAT